MFETLAHIMWFLMFFPVIASVVVGLCAIILGLVLTHGKA